MYGYTAFIHRNRVVTGVSGADCRALVKGKKGLGYLL